MSEFASLNLIQPLLSALEKTGYTKPTPIQAQAIPQLMKGEDLLGIAQTGTGKTAAFTLPILHRLARAKGRPEPKTCRVLILTPTRELASQIAASVKTYSINLRISHTVIFGGVGHVPQIRAMNRGVDILVATPGRLLDLLDQGHVKLNKVETFVLDEADRMLDMGFIHDIRRVEKVIPKDRHTILFSATMPHTITELAHGLLKNPARVEITPESTTVDRIRQTVMFVDKGNKRHLLKDLLEEEQISQALVFTRTKHGADRVTEHLKRCNITSAAIHGNKSQNARERALGGFRKGKLRVLVATDIAARGIDVAGVSHVINFDLPNEPESYVHRIGRTARAGRDGSAISFCAADEMAYLRDIERTIRQSVPVEKEHEYHCEETANAAPIKPKRGGRGGGGGGQQRRGGGGGRPGGRSGGGGRPGGGRSGGGGGGGGPKRSTSSPSRNHSRKRSAARQGGGAS
uniref:DEAD-box ATP-dependent RNA helicase RhpA n=1 Tax=Magnetococcus massalia (strain MO-1) TaxID=451514 RepID=A0A1S7LF19_MAGMO|nr:Putative ATP-dependent RNA helicase with P-loop hydrolase domain (rhlE gene) [Candidatus Magnetococcus massalia]